MTLDQLEVIHAIVEHGSFRAAANALHKSQPALSASVKTLEAEFDLFPALLRFEGEAPRVFLNPPDDYPIDAHDAVVGIPRTS